MPERVRGRRSFLKASLLTTAVLAAGPQAWASALPQPLPEGKLSLYNLHTGESLTTLFRDGWGNYDPAALEALNRLLRCHYTDEATQIDIDTVEFLASVDRKLGGGKEIHVISGYRSPTYNQYLREHGRQVAKNSYHLQGKAMDIRFPEVGLKQVKKAALKLKLGGVGYYPESRFIHLDSGDVRTWVGS